MSYSNIRKRYSGCGRHSGCPCLDFFCIEKRIYTKFYSEYFFSDEFIVIKTLETEKVLHPHAAKVLKTDNWHIDENGKFKLSEK